MNSPSAGQHEPERDRNQSEPGFREEFVGLYPAWSPPDGTLLAFSRLRPGAPNEANLVIRNMETGEGKVYHRDGYRTAPGGWFSDSGSLTRRVQEANGSASIYRADVRTGEFNLLVNPVAGTGVPRGRRFSGFGLSPDGRTFLIGGSPDSNPRFLALGGVDGSNFREIYRGDLGGAEWTPDGRSILFSRAAATPASSCGRRRLRLPGT